MQGHLNCSKDERLAAVGIDSRKEDRIETFFNPFVDSQYFRPSLDLCGDDDLPEVSVRSDEPLKDQLQSRTDQAKGKLDQIHSQSYQPRDCGN